jgi:hypothetical protein
MVAASPVIGPRSSAPLPHLLVLGTDAAGLRPVIELAEVAGERTPQPSPAVAALVGGPDLDVPSRLLE